MVVEHEIEPKIERFTVFSGGGGQITRRAGLRVAAGENVVKVKGIPASMDPETFVVTVEGRKLKIKQISMRKPTRQYVEDTLRREGTTAQNLIGSSVELGPKRQEIINVCEQVLLRTYLDEEMDVTVWVNADEPVDGEMVFSYFVDDGRYGWTPSISVEIGEGDECVIHGYIAIRNDSPHRLADVDIDFAEISRSFSDTGKLDLGQMKTAMRAQRMNVMKF